MSGLKFYNAVYKKIILKVYMPGFYRKIELGGIECTRPHLQVTPTFKSMSTTINIIIATTFKEVLPVYICQE